MRISDWSSDVCSSDLGRGAPNLKSDDNGPKRRRRSASMTPTRPAPGTANLLRRPVHPDISEALVRDLVFAVYDRISVDATLGPIFDGVIGDRWDEHLAKMCDFWSSVTDRKGVE